MQFENVNYLLLYLHFVILLYTLMKMQWDTFTAQLIMRH